MSDPRNIYAVSIQIVQIISPSRSLIKVDIVYLQSVHIENNKILSAGVGHVVKCKYVCTAHFSIEVLKITGA